jgi:hypothetical protein
MVLISGCRRDLLTRYVSVGVMLAVCLRLDVLAIAANGPAEPIGTLLTRRRPTTNQLSPARSRRLRRANTFGRVALPHAERRRLIGRLS